MKKTAKKSKKLIKESTQTERQFGVLLEDIDSKIDLLVEGHQATDKKIEDFRKDVDKRFEETDYKLNIHTEMIGSMKMDTEIIKQDIEFIKHGLKKKVDVDEFIVLEKRVAALEKSRK